MKSFALNYANHSAKDIWAFVCKQLRSSMGAATYRCWIAPLKCAGFDGSALVLSCPTKFIADWVEGHYLSKIKDSLPTEISDVKFVVGKVVAQAEPVVSEPVSSEPVQQVIDFGDYQPTISSKIDSRYKFESFVVGSSNQIAAAAAKRIAESKVVPGLNPLFLHAGVGLGKTHLMHAVANQLAQTHPELNVIYLSAEKFLHMFIRSLRDKKSLEFKEELRAADILMIDDFQFIAGKESTQDEFLHTFNALVDSGKQLVVSCDRFPSDFENISERMRSRLSSGLVLEIEPADYELRLEILKTKAAAMDIQIPEEVLEFLASKITSNIRELEGALNRVFARAVLVSEEISVENAKLWVADLLKIKVKQAGLAEIKNLVVEHFEISEQQIFSKSRLQKVARARQVAMYLARQATEKSLPEIGKYFGGKDHTTVMHAIRRVEELAISDSATQNDLEVLTKKLKSC